MSDPLMESSPQEHSSRRELVGPAKTLIKAAIERVKEGSSYGGLQGEQIVELETNKNKRVFELRLSRGHGISIYGYTLDENGEPIGQIEPIYVPASAFEWHPEKIEATGMKCSDQELESLLTDSQKQRDSELTPRELTTMAFDLQKDASQYSQGAYMQAARKWAKRQRRAS